MRDVDLGPLATVTSSICRDDGLVPPGRRRLPHSGPPGSSKGWRRRGGRFELPGIDVDGTSTSKLDLWPVTPVIRRFSPRQKHLGARNSRTRGRSLDHSPLVPAAHI